MFSRISLFAVFLLFFGLNAVASSVDVNALDTIAGYSSVLKTGQMDANANIIFRIEKPNGSVVDLSARSNNNGIVQTDFDGYHTKQAGTYKVSVAKEGKEFGSPSSFQVFADVLSPSKSSLTGDKASLSIKNDILTVRITLKDKYDNPIVGHTVKLLSSRTEDKITTDKQGMSNTDGVAVFSVQSSAEGTSIFTAMDQTINQELSNRLKTIFYASASDSWYSIGGNDFVASLTDSPQATTASNNGDFSVLDHFDINFPASVKVNDDQNHLKVSAKDKNGNTVRSYTGTIKIAVTGDDNAIIPNEGEYSFTEKDQGEKEFALAMVFTTIGTVTIDVFDYENGQINKNLKGSKTVTVTKQQDSTDGTNGKGNLSTDLAIKSPVNGSELASSTISVSGLALPHTNLKVLLNDTKVSEVSVDGEGFFSTTLSGLDDGKKEIYVMESEGQRRSSAPVTFTIDATAPRIDSISLFPQSAIFPENSYTVTLLSEPKLDYAKIRVNGIEEVLQESSVTPGKYEGTFFAPKNPGSYNINVAMSDRMGNTQEYQNQAKLEVVEKVVVKPGLPQNLIATPQDTKLAVHWDAATAEKSIDHYQVYLGESQYDLKLVGQTRTQDALISNLVNGKTYFLSVSAVTSEGTEGDKSNIIQAIPNPSTPATPKNIKLMPGDQVLNLTWDEENADTIDHYNLYFGETVSQMKKISESKTQSIALKGLTNNKTYFVALSAFGKNNVESKISEAIPTSTESFHAILGGNDPLRAIPGDSKITLSWDVFKGAVFYKISFGIKSHQYEVSLKTNDDATSFVVTDLLNDLPYYFTVKALDKNGLEISQEYTEIQAIPNGSGFKVIPSKSIPQPIIDTKKIKSLNQTGPATWIFLALAGFSVLALYFKSKKSPVKQINLSVSSGYEAKMKKMQF